MDIHPKMSRLLKITTDLHSLVKIFHPVNVIPSNVNKDALLGHPLGLFVLFFTEMWERFSYYGMRALLVLFLVSEISAGGWGWSREEALKLYGIYTGLVYVTPILGGILADKVFGYRVAVMMGALLMTCGHASMAVETPFFFYAGLTLLIIGNGFFKPNISSIVGQLYKDEPEKKDGAYTIFYMGINAGAFLGILLCGYIGEKVGWSYGFGLAGIFMLLGMVQFWLSKPLFGKIGQKLSAEEKAEQAAADDTPEHIVRDRLFVIGVFSFFTIFFWIAFEQAGGSMTIFARDYTQRILTGGAANYFFIFNSLMTILPLAVVTWVLVNLFRKTFGKIMWSNLVLAFSFIIIWAIAGWMIRKEFNTKAYEVQFINAEGTEVVTTISADDPLSEGQSIYLVDMDKKGNYSYIGPDRAEKFTMKEEATVIKQKYNETEVPASWFGILNSLFIIILAPLFSKIWASRLNPSGPVKFALGLILLGLGFAGLAFGGMDIAKGQQTATVSMMWLVIAYLLHTMGELCLSPVGLSYVSKLAPAKFVGVMFGVWFVASAIANYLAGWSGSLIDKVAEMYSISAFFLIYTFIPIFAALILIAMNGLLKKRMHGVE